MRFQKLGFYLQDLRQNSGLLQQDVSNGLGYTTNQFVSNWERGLSYPPLWTLRYLAKIYAVPVEKLYLEVESAILEDVEKLMREKFEGRSLL